MKTFTLMKKKHYTATFLDNNDQLPSKHFNKYDKDAKRLLKFRSTLPDVRRALANVPTYMIFDDHDVTDDWHMTLDWCKEVFANNLGRRIVQNGMLAYTLFQAWGNTPELFRPNHANKAGSKILELVEKWDPTSGYFVSNEIEITDPLGLPGLISSEVEFLFKKVPNHKKLMLQTTDESQIMQWHYAVKGKNFEILVLDGRTKRGYPDPADELVKKIIKLRHAAIIHEVMFKQQLPAPSADTQLTLIVAPTSIVGIPAIELNEFPFLARLVASSEFKKPTVDIYDHWKNQSDAF